MKYVAPQLGLAAYTCPHCGVYAQQAHWHRTWEGEASIVEHAVVTIGRCGHCDKWSLWFRNKLVHPSWGSAPPPHPDMPDDVRSVYEEAASICQQSPRAAGALLRLAVQQLCAELEPGAKSINGAIGRMVKRGILADIQRALDIVRVTGNSAVHPGEIDCDDIEVVGRLFPLINFIVEQAISAPAELEALYASLPQGALDAIDRRDSA